MAYGVTPEGFNTKRLQEIIDSMRERANAEFGEGINTDPDSVMGQQIAVMAAEIATVWEGMQGAYDAYRPDAAEGVSLDDVADLNGVVRSGATHSIAAVRLTAAPFTYIPSGSLVSVEITGEQFELVESVFVYDTAVSVDFELEYADSTAYGVILNGTTYSHTSGIGETAEDQVAALKVLIDASSEPVIFTDNLDGTFTIVADDDVTEFTWGLTTAKIQTPQETVTSQAVAVSEGSVASPANTLNTIDSPIAGWYGVNNIIAAELGKNIETDTELRIRRRRSVAIAGAGTVAAITSNILQVDSVSNVFIIENESTSTDAHGRPGKSFETVVEGGIDSEVGQMLWDKKPVGIETFGTTTQAVVDATGKAHNVNFSRPEPIWVHYEIDYTLNPEEQFPVNGEDTIAEISAATSTEIFGIGDDIILQKLLGAIYIGVTGLSTVEIRQSTSSTEGGAPGAFSTSNLAIGEVERGNFAVSRITVTEV